MVSLKLQKRLAASVLKCGRGKVWLDPNEGNEISMANSRMFLFSVCYQYLFTFMLSLLISCLYVMASDCERSIVGFDQFSSNDAQVMLLYRFAVFSCVECLILEFDQPQCCFNHIYSDVDQFRSIEALIICVEVLGLDFDQTLQCFN